MTPAEIRCTDICPHGYCLGCEDCPDCHPAS
jgi:hypothetical protein